MKKIEFSILGLIISLFFTSCKDFTENMSYNFFSKEELNNININQDSAMNLQTKVSNLKTYDEFISNINSYEEHDTVYFRDENGDTLKMLNGNKISVQNVPSLFTRTGTKTTLFAVLMPVISSTFEMVSFGLVKESNETVFKEILATRPNNDYQNSLYYRFVGIAKIDSVNDKRTIQFDKYIWKNTTIDSCMIFTEYDTTKNETFKIIYSNAHGFLLIKDKQHEIIKI